MLGVQRAVGEQEIAEPADRSADHVHGIVDPAVHIEALVLQNHRNVINSPVPGEGELRAFIVLYEKQAGQSHGHMAAGFLMRVGVKPAGRRGLVDVQLGLP